MFNFIDFVNVETALLALWIVFFIYRQYRTKILAPLYTFLVITFALQIVVFYGVVLYCRWVWGIQTSSFFQDWSAIMRNTEVLCMALLAASMIRFRGKGGKI